MFIICTMHMTSCPAPRMGPLSSTPSTIIFPLACTKSQLYACSLQRPTTQLRSYKVRVWSFETFIVCGTVIDRYIMVKTYKDLNKLLLIIFTYVNQGSIH